jgi:hypothetical protein
MKSAMNTQNVFFGASLNPELRAKTPFIPQFESPSSL